MQIGSKALLRFMHRKTYINFFFNELKLQRVNKINLQLQKNIGCRGNQPKLKHQSQKRKEPPLPILLQMCGGRDLKHLSLPRQ